jgi:hypothetical protein
MSTKGVLDLEREMRLNSRILAKEQSHRVILSVNTSIVGLGDRNREKEIICLQ